MLFDEAIAEAVERDDVTRLGRVGLDFLSQSRDVVVDGACYGCAVVAPNFVEQLIACDDFTAMADQVTENLKLAS